MTSIITAPEALPITAGSPRRLLNYVQGEWVAGVGSGAMLHHAVTGEPVAEAGTGGVDFAGTGNPALVGFST